MVDANGVCAQFLHERGIASALSGVGQRVVGGQLIGDALDEELCAIIVEELVAMCRDGGDGLDSGESSSSHEGETDEGGQSHHARRMRDGMNWGKMG